VDAHHFIAGYFAAAAICAGVRATLKTRKESIAPTNGSPEGALPPIAAPAAGLDPI
jgi:hypothetical protein